MTEGALRGRYEERAAQPKGKSTLCEIAVMGVTSSGLACGAEPTRSRCNLERHALVGVHVVSVVVGGAIAQADVRAVKVLTCPVTIRLGERRCVSATCR